MRTCALMPLPLQEMLCYGILRLRHVSVLCLTEGILITAVAIIVLSGTRKPLPLRGAGRGGQLLRPGGGNRSAHRPDARRHPRLRALTPALRKDLAAPRGAPPPAQERRAGRLR